MKKLYLLLLMMHATLTLIAQAPLLFTDHYQLTPNTQDSIGVFCRTFYHAARNKYYTVYAGKPTAVSQQQFSWREYDTDFAPTGAYGILAGFSNNNVGDFAMVMVGTNYYHVTGAANSWSYKLSKYDEDFSLLNSVIFAIDSSDSKADMLLSYTNGKLIIGAFHQAGVYHPTMPMQTTLWQPVMHKFEYDTTLSSVAAPVYLNEVFSTWGASCIYNSNKYNIITFHKWNGQVNVNFEMKVYRYDSNWNYIDSVSLNNDGQWSQGIVWDGTNYYVAYHSGHSHQAGNITLAMYDVNWSLVYDTVITSYSNFVQFISPPLFTTDYNANRPFITKVNDTLVVSYDVDDYQLQNWVGFFLHSNRWQAHVMRFKINSLTGINEINNALSFSIFPNPVQNNVTVQITGQNFLLQVFDIAGKKVWEQDSVSSKAQIDCSSFSKGVYILQAKDANRIYFSKMIKQ